MKVGVSENDPWVVLGTDGPSGVEVEVVELFAEELDAEIEWVEGSTDELAAAVHMRELDLLIAGLTSTSKITSEATLTHPYLTTQVVVATPPEMDVTDIAGVEVSVEEFTEAAGVLEKTDAIPIVVPDITEAEGAVAVESYLLDDLNLEDTGVRLIESDQVMALPHGENAWLTRLERFLLENNDEIDQILEREDL